jgi:F-type H+-transporting ATPase subunit epsilon
MQIEIITPERSYNLECDFVVADTPLGELGILPGHAYLISEVVPCVVRIKSKGEIKKFAVSHGIIEVTSKKVTLLVNTAEEEHEIDVERARSAKERALKMIEELRKKNEDISEVENALKRALARLKAAGEK